MMHQDAVCILSAVHWGPGCADSYIPVLKWLSVSEEYGACGMQAQVTATYKRDTCILKEGLLGAAAWERKRAVPCVKKQNNKPRAF